MSETMEKRTYEPLDELRYVRITNARISPDSQWVVYQLVKNDLQREETSSSLWRVQLDSGEARQLTHGQTDVLAEWSPDGRQIAFLSGRSGKRQIYLMPIDGGEPRQLTFLEQGVGSGPAWSPDGQTIAFTAPKDIAPPDPSKPFRLTRNVYRFEGTGYLDNAVQNVFIQNVQGGEPKQLTDDDHLDKGLRWSPDGREILYLASHDPDRLEAMSSKLRVVNLDGEVEELLGLDEGLFLRGQWFRPDVRSAVWDADGQRVLFAAARWETGLEDRLDVWVLDRAGGKPENRTEGLKWGIYYGAGIVIDADTTLIDVRQEGKIGIYALKLTGEPHWQQLIDGKRGAVLMDANDKMMVFTSSTHKNPGELCVANVDGSAERQITHVNRELVGQIDFPTLEHIRFKNPDGIQIEGWMLLPTQGEAPFPTILCIHGGPHDAFGYWYASDLKMLAGAGYAVLFTNPQGSAGYGDEFAAALVGNWGVLDYKDQMAAVDYAIERGVADPDRLGVCGISYGGYMTCYIVGQTNRFKAAVAENPITDLVSFYGTSDIARWWQVRQQGGKPHEVPEVYRRSSPISFAHRCTTPTLLVQGEIDYRCPAGQSEQFYAHLRANDCIAEMVRFPGMAHVGSIAGPITVQKTQNEALLGWMNKYVLGLA
ncbi:MAG: S9 family peptidase [Chloroflexi bacterium]|nr:S9 family peptidase [Chloroflexota bacterium]